MAIHFGLELVSGKDNIRLLPKTATTGIWTAGDLLTITSGLVMPRTAAGTSVESGDTPLETVFAAVAMTTEVTDANAETNNVQVPVSIITPEQVWSIKVEDAKRASDYTLGAGYKIGYYGESETYDIDYASGGTTRTITIDETYFLIDAAASEHHGAVIVAYPNKKVGADLNYGGRVHVRFAPDSCQQFAG